jgi:hypothetical protein
MPEHDGWRQSWVDDPVSAVALVERAGTARQRELTAAATLHEAIDGLTRAFVAGNALERAAARDRFERALVTYAALIET